MLVSSHRNRADLIALLADLGGEACVFPSEQQDITRLKLERAQALTLVPAAADQPVRVWQGGCKGLKI